MKGTLLIDGHNYLFRSYYGVPSSAKLPNGLQVNAYYGFMSLVRKMSELTHPKNILVVFDSETGIKEKVLKNSSYKQNRKYIDTGMFSQLPIIKQALDYLNIAYIEHPDYEGDDVIGSIARQESESKNVYIASQDKDFFQLIDNRTSVLRTEKGEIVEYSKEVFKDRYGFDSDRYLEYLSLLGDPSDNIKGIYGIGKKTAYKLVCNNEGLLENEEFIIAKQNYDFLKINNSLKISYSFKDFSEEKLQISSNEILKKLKIDE